MKGLIFTMDDVGRYLWGAIIILLLTAAAAFFSGCSAALLSITEKKLRKLADDGDAHAKRLVKTRERLREFKPFVQMAKLLCVVVACLYGTYLLLSPFKLLLDSFITNEVILSVVACVAAFIIISFVVFLLGESLPKKIVANDPQKFLLANALLLDFLLYIFVPLTFFPVAAARLIAKALGYDPDLESHEVTEEEIRLMVDASNETGNIELSEREMINNIFEFDDRTAGEVMTHRTDLIAVEKKTPISEVIKAAMEEGFSRIPVYDEVIDNIVGVIYAKDLLGLIGSQHIEDKTTAGFIRSALYVPESAKCRMLFKEFKEKKTHMAVVVDEYGGTAGIVTMEDLIESILGNIQDEYDREEEEILPISDGEYSLDGGINISELSKLFEVSFDSDEDTDTLGGLIVDALGRIPQDNEHPSVIIENVEFTVAQTGDRRIMRVTAKKLLPKETIEE